MNSGVILMKYGKFTYYNGGDIGGGPHPSFKTKHRDAESQIADLIGGHVTMIKPDHHGWQESSNGYFNDYRYPELWKNFVPYYGHVVVRVYEGGTKYQVFVLDSKVPDYHILYKTEIEECR